MKYIVLILTVLIITNTLKPSNLKKLTLKDQFYKITNNINNKDEVFTYIGAGLILTFIYCAILAIYIKTAFFTMIMALWISQSIYKANIMCEYIKEKIEPSIMNSIFYKTIFSNIIDMGICGYVIYFTFINW